MSYEEDGEVIDWENPFTEIRSSEVDDITLEFVDGGRKILKEDDKGETYSQFKWTCIRKDISTPAEITYMTSSKKLINELKLEVPLDGKTFNIRRTGTGFQTQYKVKKV